MTTTRITKTIFSLGIGLCVLCLGAESAEAVTTMKWCTHWKGGYVDGGFGEDMGNSTATYNWPAKYAPYQLKIINEDKTEDLVWFGNLDASGCTPPLLLLPYTKFKFRQRTVINGPSGRKVWVQPNGDDVWRDGAVWVNSYYTTTYIIPNHAYTHTFRPSWHSPETRAISVATRMMHKASALAYPTNSVTRIRTDGENTPHGGCGWTRINSNGDCCINSSFQWDPQGSGTIVDHSKYKWVIGHELGHRQAHAAGGPITGVSLPNYAPQWTTAHPCNCVDMAPDPNIVCLGSRTSLAGAQQEGWANFIAAAIFNNRTSSGSPGNCKMAWWNMAWDTSPPNPPFQPSFDWTPPVDIDCDFAPRWMERFCTGNNSNRGVILDWQNFFWILWTGDQTTSERVDVDEISDIFATDNTDTWSSFRSEAASILNSTQLSHFDDTGALTGVDH